MAHPRDDSKDSSGLVDRRRVLQTALATGLVATVGGASIPTASGQRALSSGADATAALNRRIAATPDGSTFTFPKDADLRVDGTVRIHDRHNLVLDGNGARLYSTRTTPLATKPVIRMIDVLGGSNITVQDLRLEGTNPDAKFVVQREWQPLIDLRGSQGVTITRVNAVGAWGDFVHIAPDARLEVDVPARSVTVVGCTTRNTGRNQVSFTGCEDVLVESCTFDGTGFQVFDVEVQAAWWRARRLRIVDNIITGRVSLSVLVNAACGAGVSDVDFSRNTMLSTPQSCEPPVHILNPDAPRSGFRVTDNVLRTLSSGARVAGVTSFVFANNQVTQVPGYGCRDGGNGVVIGSSSDVVIQGNNFLGSVTSVVPPNLYEVQNARICGNRLEARGSGYVEPTVCP